MGKGAREREERKRRQEREDAEPRRRLFHGTAGVTGPFVKARGMTAAERDGLLLCDSPEMAKEHALCATARLLLDGAGDRQGLLVEVDMPVRRLREHPEHPGYWLVRPGVKPDEVAELHYFDAGDELDDPESLIELASVFDTTSQDWRRAATGEMEE